MNLPEEIAYKILSYLPYKDLVGLNLSEKQYWNIYRLRKSKTTCHWSNQISWLKKLSGTDQISLKGELYIHSLLSLHKGYPLTFIPKIPTENTLVFFQKYLNGYVWYPLEKVDLRSIKQILNERDKSLTFFGINGFFSEDTIINLFHKFIFKHVWHKIPDEYICNSFNKECNLERQQENYSPKLHLRFPEDEETPVFLVFYLTQQTVDFDLVGLELVDEIEVDSHILWKVIKTEKNGTQTDIGRAVLSPKLHPMLDSLDIGIGLFARQNKVFGFGNFDCSKADKRVLDLIPKSVFDTYNFAIVKK